MRHPKYRLSFILIFTAALAISCATPMAPTGGEGDTKGPQLLATEPTSGTVNYDGRSFEFHFNEFLNRSNVQGALTVEPDVGIGYDISWSRKTLTISFEEDLPDSTTVLIKLSTEISDTRNNNISKPITLAVSTGDEIDQGTLQGRLRNATDGSSAEGQDILLYRQPFDFTKRANYYAQTDTGGVFQFSYLAEGRYKVVVVDDRNRNKTWEQNAEAAYPFNREFIELPKGEADTLDVLYISQTDSIAPSVQGVGLFSENRMRLRFSEDMQTAPDAEAMVSDSVGNPFTTAYPLYTSPNEPFVVFAQTNDALQEGENYTLNLNGFTDKAGNDVTTEDFSFTGSSQVDTTEQRIITANGKQGLYQDESFVVTFAAPINEPQVVDSTVVIEGDVDFQDWPAMEVNRNQLSIQPHGEWIEGVEYQFLVWNPRSQRRTLFEPQIWDSTEYGEIELTLDQTDTTKAHRVQLFDRENNLVKSSTLHHSGMIENLPPLTYTLIIFRDENSNGTWDKGTVIPYQQPEPYYVQRGLNVSEGFTSGVRISFD